MKKYGKWEMGKNGKWILVNEKLKTKKRKMVNEKWKMGKKIEMGKETEKQTRERVKRNLSENEEKHEWKKTEKDKKRKRRPRKWREKTKSIKRKRKNGEIDGKNIWVEGHDYGWEKKAIRKD